MKNSGIMLILSAPSGTGKTVITNALINANKNLVKVVSYTTRSPRSGEVDGLDYNFITVEKFKEMRKNDEFIENAKVFDNYYGTPKFIIEKYLNNGIDVICDVDWQGLFRLQKILLTCVVSVFLLPPSLKELYDRLNKRNLDTKETIEYRIKKAKSEIIRWYGYDYVIVNDRLEDAIHRVGCILCAERNKKDRQINLNNFIESLLKEQIN